MNRYIVHQPIRGFTVFSVLAETAEQAKQIVNSRSNTPDVRPIDHTIEWSGKASGAWLEEKNVERLGK